MLDWAEPNVPDYYTCRFARPRDAEKLSAREVTVAQLYGNPQGANDARTLDRLDAANPQAREPPRKTAAAAAPLDQARQLVVNQLLQCRAGGAWARDDLAEGISMGFTAAKRDNRRYASRIEACGFDEDSRKKPFSYCDRVITRTNTPSPACPFRFSVGHNGDGSYATYASLPICPASDHNVVLAAFEYEWLPTNNNGQQPQPQQQLPLAVQAGGNAVAPRVNVVNPLGLVQWTKTLAGGKWMKSPTAETTGNWQYRTLTLSCSRRAAAGPNAPPNPNPTVRISWAKDGLENGHGFLMFTLPNVAAPEPNGIPAPALNRLLPNAVNGLLTSPAVLCDAYNIGTPWRVSMSDSPKICIAVHRATTKQLGTKRLAEGTSTFFLRILRENKSDRAGALPHLNAIIEEAKRECQ